MLIAGLVILVPLVITGLILAPDGFMGKLDAVGFAVCHQIPERSFSLLDGDTMPLCARCSGTFLGVLIGLFGPKMLYGRRRAGLLPTVRILIVLGLATAAWGFDGANSFNHLLANSPIPRLYPPSNTLRVITGMFNGITMGSVILPLVNASLWADAREERTIGSFHELAILYLAGAIVIAMILSEWPAFLYPLSVLSTLGVLAILTAIHSMVVLALFKQENTALTLKDALPFFLFGAIITVTLIFGIDALRYGFFGSWQGLDPALYQ